MISLLRPHFSRSLVAASAVALACAAAPVSAQDVGFALDQFRPAESPTDGFAISRPTVLPHLHGAGQLTLDYARSPLVSEVAGADDVDLVKHHLVGTASVAFGLFDQANVFVLVPISLEMSGAAVGGIEKQTFGDPVIGGRIRLVGEDDQPFALGANIAVSLPVAELSSSTQRFAGERTATFMPEVLAEVRIGDRVRIAGNLGARVRGRSELVGLDLGSEMTFGIGAQIVALPNELDVHFEMYGATGFNSFFEREETPVEMIGGVRVQPVPGFIVGLAGGTGLTPGYGSPELRGILQVGYAAAPEPPPAEEPAPEPTNEDRDGDGILNDADGCADEPEDVDQYEDEDGCPDADNDGDNIPDASDAAPLEPEDVDQFEDEDGAPDLDNDADGIPDTSDRCPTEAEDRDSLQDEDGCPETDVDGDTLLDPDDHCPLTPGVANERNPECSGCPALACMSEPGVIRILQRIEFENNSDALRAESTPVLEAVKTVLETNPQILRVRVEGHTDDRGPDARNLDLSRRRATSVVTWLTTHGIAAERLEAEGLGETRPLQPNTSNATRQANRRVEFHIVDPAPPAATETPVEGGTATPPNGSSSGPAANPQPLADGGRAQDRAMPEDPATPATP